MTQIDSVIAGKGRHNGKKGSKRFETVLLALRIGKEGGSLGNGKDKPVCPKPRSSTENKPSVSLNMHGHLTHPKGGEG